MAWVHAGSAKEEPVSGGARRLFQQQSICLGPSFQPQHLFLKALSSSPESIFTLSCRVATTTTSTHTFSDCACLSKQLSVVGPLQQHRLKSGTQQKSVSLVTQDLASTACLYQACSPCTLCILSAPWFRECCHDFQHHFFHDPRAHGWMTSVLLQPRPVRWTCFHNDRLEKHGEPARAPTLISQTDQMQKFSCSTLRCMLTPGCKN